jgi:hypothetical protein
VPQLEDKEFQRRIGRIETLVHELEAADERTRASAEELVQALLDLHGAGLDRLLGYIEQIGPAGQPIVENLLRDDLVSSLLLLHGLHPEDLEIRLRRALDRARLELGSEARIELVGIADGVASVRLEPTSQSACASVQLERAVETALYEAAPDLERIELTWAAQVRPATFIPLEAMLGLDNSAAPNGTLLAVGDDGRSG